MAFVITAACIDVKEGVCITECPVDCIHEGGRMMYINPHECIDCGFCVPACPVAAIYEDVDLSLEDEHFAGVNRRFFYRSLGENLM